MVDLSISNLTEYVETLEAMIDNSKVIKLSVFKWHKDKCSEIREKITEEEGTPHRDLLLKLIDYIYNRLDSKIKSAESKREKSRIAVEELIAQGLKAGQEVLCRACSITRCKKKVMGITEDNSYIQVECPKYGVDGYLDVEGFRVKQLSTNN